MIINCTPHAIEVYDPGTPNIVDPERHVPTIELAPSGMVARINERILDGETHASRVGADVPITFVEYGHVTGLPDEAAATWYVVSLPIALALPGRRDLLVPYRQVRNERGTVVGCRSLARPS